MAGFAQQIQFEGGNRAAEARKQHVELVSGAVEVKAGALQTVELRFRVDQGFHINSHAPKDELLLPTELKWIEGGTLRVTHTEYPKGTPFRLQVGEGETLDVYQGEFRLRLSLLAPKGASTLEGSLRYQACDNAACFPPRTLPVKVAITGR